MRHASQAWLTWCALRRSAPPHLLRERKANEAPPARHVEAELRSVGCSTTEDDGDERASEKRAKANAAWPSPKAGAPTGKPPGRSASASPIARAAGRRSSRAPRQAALHRRHAGTSP